MHRCTLFPRRKSHLCLNFLTNCPVAFLNDIRRSRDSPLHTHTYTCTYVRTHAHTYTYTYTPTHNIIILYTWCSWAIWLVYLYHVTVPKKNDVGRLPLTLTQKRQRQVELWQKRTVQGFRPIHRSNCCQSWTIRIVKPPKQANESAIRISERFFVEKG